MCEPKKRGWCKNTCAPAELKLEFCCSMPAMERGTPMCCAVVYCMAQSIAYHLSVYSCRASVGVEMWNVSPLTVIM